MFRTEQPVSDFCLCSDELDLGDVMDIELDFPTLEDSQDATAPQTQRLSEVS